MLRTDQNPEIAVVFCADRKVLKGLEVAFVSALHHLGSEYRLRALLFSLDLRPEDEAQLRQRLARVGKPCLFELIDLDLPRLLAGRAVRRFYGGVEPYAKLLVPDLVQGVRRIIWLDTDVVVCSCLSELYASDLHGRVVGAVPESTIAWAFERDFYRSQGFSDEEHCFNSGVMLIDVERWKADELTKRALQVLDAHGPRLNGDQTVLNMLLRNAFTPLPKRFNQMRYPSSPAVDLERVDGIYHLLCRPKPWDLLGETVNRNGPLFCKYLDMYSDRRRRSYQRPSLKALLHSARLARSYYTAFAHRRAPGK